MRSMISKPWAKLSQAAQAYTYTSSESRHHTVLVYYNKNGTHNNTLIGICLILKLSHLPSLRFQSALAQGCGCTVSDQGSPRRIPFHLRHSNIPQDYSRTWPIQSLSRQL